MKRVVGLILALLLCFSLCACKSKEAEKADELILAIGTVTLDSEDAITAAQVYVSTLNDSQKQQVENLAVLEAAQSELAALKAEAELEEQYNTAVAYEDASNPMAAKAIYEEMPSDYKDVAERLEIINAFLSVEGRWVCTQLNVVGSNGRTYQPRSERYDISVEPSWTISYAGGNSVYKRGELPFESVVESYNGIDDSRENISLRLNDDGLLESGRHGMYGDLNCGFDYFDITMYFDMETQTLRVVYETGYKPGTVVTVEFVYHKQ